jgi:hypothetical protein
MNFRRAADCFSPQSEGTQVSNLKPFVWSSEVKAIEMRTKEMELDDDAIQDQEAMIDITPAYQSKPSLMRPASLLNLTATLAIFGVSTTRRKTMTTDEGAVETLERLPKILSETEVPLDHVQTR